MNDVFKRVNIYCHVTMMVIVIFVVSSETYFSELV